ncbi:Thiosulfate reductase cytochrome b subunit [Marinobacter segnicrescens]|uniref:Thiosulfate reductase cytochrome b subunit n=1 Tax=Marinobacter segnicrescens TaxID=430453 RepID=A0A1I0BN78_9GAMM|nr:MULTISPECIES: cytochrome b/b6 domain-containing protein [Marinobacter]UZD67184.1 cytochrome b/b6 domain-containing protein [Marinobacter sp. AN1]SET08419.1 Thiosulfate reductase cytochrome b subunit [Marinobacter segnicrescens]
MSRVMIYKRFERFWHWCQALLIFTLLFTGFEIHGSYSVLGFGDATQVHTLAAWALIVLWLFAIFWHITTGEWRQYIPTRNGLFAVIHYYLVGTFTGAEHPYRKTTRAKHNPLQRLAYLFFKLVISPVIWVSGLLYLFYADWPAMLAGTLALEWVAMIHTAAAFAMLVFIIAHVYMTTMGHTLTSHIRPMVTGYDDIDEK